MIIIIIIQTYHLIPARIPNLVIITKKENLPFCGLFLPSEPLRENQRKPKERQVLRLCQRTKTAVKHEGDGDINCNWCAWNGPQKPGKGIERDGNSRTNRDHLNYSIVEIGQNTENTPGDLRRLVVT